MEDIIIGRRGNAYFMPVSGDVYLEIDTSHCPRRFALRRLPKVNGSVRFDDAPPVLNERYENIRKRIKTATGIYQVPEGGMIECPLNEIGDDIIYELEGICDKAIETLGSKKIGHA